MGTGVVLDAFIAIVIGGLGSFTGAIVGSLLLGQVRASASPLPGLSHPLVFLVMAAVLIFRPTGLFGARRAPIMAVR
jgi:branched-subunit amino acid ABC-type transport system permease component